MIDSRLTIRSLEIERSAFNSLSSRFHPVQSSPVRSDPIAALTLLEAGISSRESGGRAAGLTGYPVLDEFSYQFNSLFRIQQTQT